ncbi:type II secretion system protein GspM [Silvimonas iriomotensis]|uniref:Type II secretion system protein M n=1 Tax=Silvimonas iriomotensis TaxID=449662 RepID=A0ABQ2P5B1_9NEIS|nr:type II secretion system protein M [Silvimonas iriomotensis]GGP18438.1 type II secretion system protein M [Silvimonas iriomotensis]
MNQYIARAQQFWLGRNARERAMLSACAALIVFAILYTGLWQPLVTQRAQLDKRVPQLQSQLAQMQHDLQLLKGGVTVARTDDLRQAVSSSLQQHGIKADLQALPDNKIRIDAPQADFTHVLDLLGALPRETGAHVVNFDANGAQNDGVVHFSAVVQR